MSSFEELIKPVINGTKWSFINVDGMKVDLSDIPKQTAKLYDKYLD
jgi:hypothetical protein